MQKNDLKTGMKLEWEDGSVGVVLRGTEYGDIISGNERFPFVSMRKDLSLVYTGTKIRRVYAPRNIMAYLQGMNGCSLDECRIIYDREEMEKEEVEYTKEEISSIAKTISMWEWLAENHNKNKCDWFKMTGENIAYDCYLCQHYHSNYNCGKCPLALSGNACINTNKAGFIEGSIFHEWLRNEKNPLKRKVAARKIADICKETLSNISKKTK